MRTLTETRTLYTFGELSDDAKERARDWYRSCMDSSDYAEFLIEDVSTIAALLGIEFDTHRVPLMSGAFRNEPDIYWSGFCSQGDGASFAGWYAYAKGCSAAVRAYAPQDAELHRIADTLASIQRRNFYRLQATITARSAHYSHSGTMFVDVSRTDDVDVSYVEEETLQDLMRTFADWIYSRLETEYEYANSDETIDANIQANEYEFTETGDIA